VAARRATTGLRKLWEGERPRDLIQITNPEKHIEINGLQKFFRVAAIGYQS
jgi:hypothetical protein